METTKAKNDQMSQAYHKKFMTVIVFDQMKPDHIKDMIFFEKEAVECMEDSC